MKNSRSNCRRSRLIQASFHLAPFLDLRVLRMAGDEKVYVSQSIEMARRGTWFVQTLADEPNYFKGPMHFVLVRAGMLVFGDHLAAGVWMNALFALLAGLAMYRLGKKRWDDRAGLLLGLATALNVGAYSHALASQMEVEVYAFYAFATAALGLSQKKDDFLHDLLFWLSAGLVGWSKSPVHSVLIGTGGLLYWGLTGQLWAKATSLKAWVAALIGICAGIAGYAPAYLLDRENFVNAFVLREQFEKANNARTWDYVMKPLIYFLLPWTFLVLGGLAVTVWSGVRKRADKARKILHGTIAKAPALGLTDGPMLKLGVAMALPSIMMWTNFTYKGQNYNLPTLPALLLAGVACFGGAFPRWVFRASSFLGGLGLAATIALIAHFWPLPGWWVMGWLGLSLAGVAIFLLAYSMSDDVRVIGVGTIALFVAFGAFVTPLGERELQDMRKFLKEHPQATLHYYNLDPSIWSEWGLLQLTLHRPVYGLHKPAALAGAMQPGHAVLLQNTEALKHVMTAWKALPDASKRKTPEVISWTRWLTKGKTPDGRSRWKEAWISRDLRQLEREFFIVWFP